MPRLLMSPMPSVYSNRNRCCMRTSCTTQIITLSQTYFFLWTKETITVYHTCRCPKAASACCSIHWVHLPLCMSIILMSCWFTYIDHNAGLDVQMKVTSYIIRWNVSRSRQKLSSRKLRKRPVMCTHLIISSLLRNFVVNYDLPHLQIAVHDTLNWTIKLWAVFTF